MVAEPATPTQSPLRPLLSTPMSSQRSAASGDVNNVLLTVTYLNIALYALCFQLQRPVEPFLVQQLAKDGSVEHVSRVYGQLQSFFSAVQTVGSPLVGVMLDRVGVRLASAVVFLSSALSYLLLAGATTLPMLFLSKVPTALQHAFLVAQATASVATAGDSAHPDIRAAALGRMTTAYTVGATIGPFVGGMLAERGDLYAGARVAVLGSLVSALLSLAFLPREAEERRQYPSSAPRRKESFVEEVARASRLVLRPALWPLLAVKVGSGVAASMHQTALPLVLTQLLKYDPAELGAVLSASMLSVAAFGAVGVAPLIRLFSAPSVVRWGLLSRSVLVLAMAAAVSRSAEVGGGGGSPASRFSVTAFNVLASVASHALATSLTTLTTGAVGRDEQGALLGLEHGLFSLARIAGPPAGALLLSAAGFGAVSFGCGLVDAGLVALLLAVPASAADKDSALNPTRTATNTPTPKVKD